MSEPDVRARPGAAHRIKFFDAMLGNLRKHHDVQISSRQRIHGYFAAQVQP
jgi:hypothetical protein